MLPKPNTKLIDFTIEHMDSLGQGVSKKDGAVTFIAKTLPGETGQAVVFRKSKKVQFAELKQLTRPSPHRTNPDCEHFEKCEGCAFLHTDYSHELHLKLEGAKHQFKKILTPEKLTITGAPERLGYRNRIQLHYDTRAKKLGFLTHGGKRILEVPHCLIALPSVTGELKRLYQNSAWLELVKDQPTQGHIEIYQKADSIEVSVNRPYASGGFTQVYEDMNQLLIKRLESLVEPQGAVLDFFGGKGNLTRNFTNSTTLVVDATPDLSEHMVSHQTYLCLDLYASQSLEQLQGHLSQLPIDGLVLDPPRSGYKELTELVKITKPNWVAYVSCFYPTLIRDISSITDEYSIEHAELFDFFPATKHSEAFLLLKKKQRISP